MIKLFFGLTIFATAFVSAAPAIALNSDSDLTYRVKELSARMNARIQREADQLSTRDLLDTYDHLRAIAEILREDNSSPRPPVPQPRPPGPPKPPGPQPRPPIPQPPIMPPHGRDAIIRGLIEDRSFTIEGRSLEEVNDSCESFYSANISGRLVDDISYSVNFGSTVTLRNRSGYWKTSGEVCSQILSGVKAETRLPVSLQHRYILQGVLESKSFVLKGRNLSELNAQCESFHRSSGLSLVDDITVAVNFDTPIVKRNKSGYWKTTFEVCDQIIGAVNGH